MKCISSTGLVIADVVDPVGRRRRRRIGARAVPCGVGRRDAVGGAQHALDHVVDVGEVARMVAVVEHSIGSPARMLRVNLNSAMSGRPHGPYTVKKRSPVTGRR